MLSHPHFFCLAIQQVFVEFPLSDTLLDMEDIKTRTDLNHRLLCGKAAVSARDSHRAVTETMIKA